MSAEQTPLWQTRAPLFVVHVPLIGAMPGSGCPFGVFGVHVPAPHHSVPAQSASTKHVLPHPPVAVLQIDPVCVPMRQSPLTRQRPHEPPLTPP